MAVILAELQKDGKEEREMLPPILEKAVEKHEGENVLVRYEPKQTFTLQKGYIFKENEKGTSNPLSDVAQPAGFYKVGFKEFSKIITSKELENVAKKLASWGY